MLSLITCLQAQDTKFGSGSEEVPALITDLLSTAISAADYYQLVPKKAPATSYSYYQPTPTMELSPATALLHINTAINTRNDELVDVIIKKLVSMTGVPANDIWRRAQSVLLPLIEKMNPIIKSRPEGSPPIRRLGKLYSWTVAYALHLSPQQGISNSELDTLLNLACTVDGGGDLVREL